MSLTAGRLWLAAIVVAGAHLPSVVPAHAQAEGQLCSFWATVDPTGEPDVRTGEVHGGPVVAAGLTGQWVDPTASISVRCVIQVGPIGATHAGPDAASASALGTGVVVMSSTSIDFVARSGDDVYLCPEITLNGTSHYWDDTSRTFSLSSSASCRLATALSLHQHEPVVDDLRMLADGLHTVVDDTICPFPDSPLTSEGDIPGVWDCPPYNVAATSEHDTGVWFACVTVRGPVCV